MITSTSTSTLAQVAGEIEILATNLDGFGKGKTIEEAKANCRKATRKAPKSFWIVPKGTSMVDFMTVEYPAGAKFHEMVKI